MPNPAHKTAAYYKYEQQFYKEWVSPIYTIDDCINRVPIADQSRCSVLQSRMSRYEGRFIILRCAFAIGAHLKPPPRSITNENWRKMLWSLSRQMWVTGFAFRSSPLIIPGIFSQQHLEDYPDPIRSLYPVSNFSVPATFLVPFGVTSAEVAINCLEKSITKNPTVHPFNRWTCRFSFSVKKTSSNRRPFFACFFSRILLFQMNWNKINT